MGDNYQEYALLVSDDPLEQCILYFWDSLEDDIYSKSFLESLMQMADDVETGKVKTYSMDEVMERVKNSLDWADEVLDGVDLDGELDDE